MPHLSPMKWLILSLTFWTILLFSMVMTWWQAPPRLSPFSSSFTTPLLPKWPWS